MKAVKSAVLFVFGGLMYLDLEIIWRIITKESPTHWTMFLLGGLLFVMIGRINERIPWGMPLLLQGVIGAAMVTGTELVAGIVLNLWLGLGIWDYTDIPCNLWGQICLSYSLLWVLLSIFAVVLDDWLRWLIWGETIPHYTFWRWGRERAFF